MPLPLLLYLGEQLQVQTDSIEEYFHRQLWFANIRFADSGLTFITM